MISPSFHLMSWTIGGETLSVIYNRAGSFWHFLVIAMTSILQLLHFITQNGIFALFCALQLDYLNLDPPVLQWPSASISLPLNHCILLTFWETNIIYCHIVIYYCDLVIGLTLWKCLKIDIWEMDVVLEVPFSPCPEAMPVWPFIHPRVPSWRCSALPFLIIHPQICREGFRLFHGVLCRGVFLLIGVTRSPCLSELNVISVTVKYHQLFGLRLAFAHCQACFTSMNYSLLIHPNPSQTSSAFHFATRPHTLSQK